MFHDRRWDSDFLSIGRALASGEIGTVTHFESHFDRLRTEVRDRWRERGGPRAGLSFDLGPHLVDQALLLFEQPDRVQADLFGLPPGATGWSDDPDGVAVHAGHGGRRTEPAAGAQRRYHAGVADAYAGAATAAGGVSPMQAIGVMAVIEAAVASAKRRAAVEPALTDEERVAWVPAAREAIGR